MAQLGILIVSLFFSIVSFFAKFIGTKLAITVTAIAAIVAVSATFLSAIQSLFNSIVPVIPPEMIIGISWFLPASTPTYLSIVASAKIARWVYITQYNFIVIKTST